MKRRILITGGAGFIGVNAADFYRSKGFSVSVFDNLSRKGTKNNLAWLRRGGKVEFARGDIRNPGAVERWVRARQNGLEMVLHLAAQVAVTTSVTDPRSDFDINAFGAFNVLEAVRKLKRRPLVLYSSTNKVYGGMEDVRIARKGGRYAYSGLPLGVPESRGIDFHSPYGCSKGAADQYFRDYYRIYGVPSVTFRQSCIYGPHQQGNEDQGWIAHFLKQALAKKGVTIFGDGRQVRDALYVGDLVEAFDVARRKKRRCAGKIYNVGGGPRNTLSLLELIEWIERETGRKLPVKRRGWRPGDQLVYVSDIRMIKRDLGWSPKTKVTQGLGRLKDWLES